MKYAPPIGGAANDPYIDANPGIGQDGSVVPAAAIEAPQREIVAAIAAAGLTPDEAAMTQLVAALKMGGVTFGLVTDADGHTLLDENWGKLHTYTGAGGHVFDWTNTAKPGLNFILANLGTGDLTLNPSGAQTIDGALTLVLRPGGVVRVMRVSDTSAIVVASAGTAGAGDDTDLIAVGEAVALNDVLYADAENERGGGFGTFWKIKADRNVAPVYMGERVAIARAAAAGAGTIRAQVRPGLVDGFAGLTPGQRVYIHPTTAGGITQTEPLLPATGTQVALRRLGEARAANAIWFDPEQDTLFLARNTALANGSSLTVRHFQDAGARDRQVRAYLAAIGSTALDMPGDGDYDGYAGYSFAVHFAAGTLTAGSSIRFRLAPGANGETPRIEACFFQEAGAGHQSHFAATPVRVTFGGGGNTHSFAANTPVDTDDCAVTISGSKAYTLRYWLATIAPNDTMRRRAAQSGVTSYIKLDYGADIQTLAPSGFAAAAHAVLGVTRVEVTTATRGEPLTGGSETLNSGATDRVNFAFSDSASANQNTATTGWNRTGAARDIVLEVAL